ncbi:50S ribosomal protein L13 [Candidatus Micrarchaeota archaeon]|nr:50S ribosomal protein L13 [Candidatus Micrarchaeota archaeon]
MIVVDGTDLIFGRMSSQIAKKLILGEEVSLINAEKIVLIGNPKQISERLLIKRRLKNKATPEYSPKWSRMPHLLVKRMIRGMLPKKSTRGEKALKRLRVYTGNPKNLQQNLKLENASFDGISKHITVYDLCKNIGYSG